MSIVTKRGDEGETDLLFGRRISKTAPRIEALGCVDELNAALGMARVCGAGDEIISLLDEIQQRLVGLMGELACLPEDSVRYREREYAMIEVGDVIWIENLAREYERSGVKFTGWARPGAEGSVGRSALDFARSIARRAERSIWKLHESGEIVSQHVLLFFNRLSDFLWILARSEKV
ncbi:cob(I)yrinic acid a,c-diamide adenosyltransferase [Luteolibacter pohnpeiensis]|uniref:Corrinoid adenosyltransferase n=1 Tax=Luteolibacter pohnpeiensis TaxID=454153 RepID=A0A934SEQ6_9BACT|nr:cob(I)yrinic acid a,c-diamide adenosyltransferase [Luteolibacter pohnpeiensis]MBK1884772.1 cob(I)yrinic acid a,c-diamide adenosyltransferase [Luteolibacter pohnpeiensis]